jgi:hypothetical protein
MNYDKLIKLYIDGNSANQISINNNINISSFMRILRKNNVAIRSVSDGVNLYLENTFQKDSTIINEELDEIIMGNLLGDGCVKKLKNRCIYSHLDKHIEYIEWLINIFENSSILCHLNNTINISGCYSFQTNSYQCLNDYYIKFYKEKRIVPLDIILTPIVLRQWFISDGTNSKQSGLSIAKSPYNDNLMVQLKNIIGEKCSYHLDLKRGWGKYYIPKKYKEKFFEYIGKSPIQCYEYKWRM